MSFVIRHGHYHRFACGNDQWRISNDKWEIFSRYITARPATSGVLSRIEFWDLGGGVAASRGACPVSIIVFIRSRSASISLFGSTPKNLAMACPIAPAIGLYLSLISTCVAPLSLGRN